MKAMSKKFNLSSGTRGSRITSIGIWFAASLLVISIALAFCYWGWLSEGESAGSTLRNVAVIVAGLIALPLAIARILVVGDQADTADRSLANDRYQRGAEMLGHNEAIVRIGGIDALKGVAQQYPGQYVPAAMRLFCAFLRNHCTGTSETPKFPERLDLQEAVKAISTFGPNQRGTVQQENTRDSLNLGGVRFFYATLWNFNFAGMDLRVAQFEHCNLCGTNFAGADLRSAIFRSVNMEEAILDGARIDHARFSSEIEGLTQEQLDKASAIEGRAPNLKGTLDKETGQPLTWKG